MLACSKLPVRLIGFLLLVWVVIASAAAEEYREWTDSTGNYKLRAKLEGVEDGKVTLLRENGRRVKIAIEKLSEADQKYVTEHTGDNPFEDVDDGEPVKTDEVTADDCPRTVRPDWTQSRAILPMAPGETWEISLPSSPRIGHSPKSAMLPPKRNFFDKISGLAINRAANAAVVGYVLQQPGGKETSVRVVLCDLKKGRTTASAESTGENIAPVALHDDGQRILMRRNEFGFGNQGRLEIWTIDGGNIVRGLTWTPYGEAADGNADAHHRRRHGRRLEDDVLWAEFIDADRLATVSGGGKIAIWDLATGQPICHLGTSRGSIPSLSPDRKLIAYATQNALGVFDIEKQEVVAMQKTPRPLHGPMVAFSPSGRKIGCIAHDRILVWDTASGALEQDFCTPGILIHGAIAFPSEDCILAKNQYLIDLPNQLKLWEYQGADQIRTLGGASFMAIRGDDNSGLLLATKLPHAEAKDLRQKALKQPDLFIFHKGTPVCLDVSGIPEDHRESVEEALVKKLDAMDCPVEDSAKVRVVAVVDGPKHKKVSYRHSGTYKVKEYRTRLKFVYNEQTLWEHSCTNIPHIIRLDRDDNIENYLRKASSSPTYSFYDHIVLPEFLQKPLDQKNQGSQQTLGLSKLTPQGIP